VKEVENWSIFEVRLLTVTMF